MQFISDGPPALHTITSTDEPGIYAVVLCLVDGFPARISHNINTKRQEYNRHNLEVFDSTSLTWNLVLHWDFNDAGHIPTYPEDEALRRLRDLSRVMWEIANMIVTQSRQRAEDLDMARADRARTLIDTESLAEQMAREADPVRQTVSKNQIIDEAAKLAYQRREPETDDNEETNS